MWFSDKIKGNALALFALMLYNGRQTLNNLRKEWLVYIRRVMHEGQLSVLADTPIIIEQFVLLT